MIHGDIRIPRNMLRHPDTFGGLDDGVFRVGQARWQDERLVCLSPPRGTPGAPIVLPVLVEPHCHLDKCHSLHRLGQVGGDLAAAIAAQAADKHNWTSQDLTERALKGLRECARSGCGLVRSHIDWGDTAAPPLSWEVLTQLAAEDLGMTIQWAALTGIDQMSDADFAKNVGQTVARQGGVLGSFILFHDAADRQAGLANMFRQADRFGLMLDFHVDEGSGAFNGLEAIADMALETRFEGPILCGHAVSLMDRSTDDFARIADKLTRANISICALPTTNLYLQGRGSGTPDRRGITCLRELDAVGVPIVIGSDNVADAFCPVGQHDPMAALHLAILGAHLDPPLDRWLELITLNAAKALGQPAPFVDNARRADLLFAPAGDLADVIAGRRARLRGDHPFPGAQS